MGPKIKYTTEILHDISYKHETTSRILVPVPLNKFLY